MNGWLILKDGSEQMHFIRKASVVQMIIGKNKFDLWSLQVFTAESDTPSTFCFDDEQGAHKAANEVMGES